MRMATPVLSVRNHNDDCVVDCLSDHHWVAHSDTMRHAKRLREDKPWVTRKRSKTQGPPELNFPADIQAMVIPLEDMKDVIVLTGL